MEPVNNATDLLLDTSGRVMAMEFALKVIIATHPEPAKLAARWREQATKLIDVAMDNPLYATNASYRDGLNGTLERLSQHLKAGS